MHELSYAYSVVDAFTQRLLPMHRSEFESISAKLELLDIGKEDKSDGLQKETCLNKIYAV